MELSWDIDNTATVELTSLTLKKGDMVQVTLREELEMKDKYKTL